MARVYQRKKEYDKAINYALQSIKLSTQNLYRDKTREAYGILYEIYQDKSDYEKAFMYYKQYNVYKDSIFSEDRMQYIENLKINYELERIKQENVLKKDAELKDLQLSQQYTYVVVFIIAILFILIAGTLVYRISLQRKRTNAVLNQYNQDLESQVKDRTKELLHANQELMKQNIQLEQFGYIIAHNLRAPIARLLGLASIAGNTEHFSLPRDSVVLEKIKSSAEELDTVIRSERYTGRKERTSSSLRND